MTIKEALEPIENLSPEGIAEFLESKGCKGLRGISDRCPIAMFMETCGIPTSSIMIGEDYIALANSLTDLQSVDCSPCLSEFISNFDNGMYPELDIEHGNA